MGYLMIFNTALARAIILHTGNVVSDVTGGNRNGNILRLAYGDNMRRSNGQNKVCGAKSSNTNAFWASTYPPDQTGGVQNDLQTKYRIADSMIVFCPALFDVNVPNDVDPLPNDADALAAHALLDGLRTKGRLRFFPSFNASAH